MIKLKNNIILSKHISPSNSEEVSIRRKFLTINHIKQPSHHDPKLHLKSVDIDKNSIYANSKAFDSNYSENGTWLDSKFTSNKSKELKPFISNTKSILEENLKNAPSTFSKASSGKKINDYILMGKVK